MSTVRELVRDKILDAAIDLLKKDQIQNISLSQIAKQAGVSRMTVYRNFKDKFEIEHAIYERDFNSIKSLGLRDPVEVIKAQAKLFMTHKDVYRNIFTDRVQQNSFFEKWMELSRASLLEKVRPENLTEEFLIAVNFVTYGGFYVSWACIQGKINMDIDRLVDMIVGFWPPIIKSAMGISE
ncbi:TetR/AcrR family transcriptional regulator [uncultured Oscillibacter sp.]|uniref:TetR/AcrR family transcriptional regulator n=1 Tax=uncultured Oscillibacter sp. TaxID=876091 RepID=UPI002803F6DB|nr:TetR/AcrR family transcriptional regulator [uncultured Oscillibacter sp.]